MANICVSVNRTVYVLLSHKTSHKDHILGECVANRWRFTAIGGIFTMAIVYSTYAM